MENVHCLAFSMLILIFSTISHMLILVDSRWKIAQKILNMEKDIHESIDIVYKGSESVKVILEELYILACGLWVTGVLCVVFLAWRNLEKQIQCFFWHILSRGGICFYLVKVLVALLESDIRINYFCIRLVPC